MFMIEKELNTTNIFNKLIKKYIKESALAGHIITNKEKVEKYMRTEISEQITDFLNTNAELTEIEIKIYDLEKNGLNKIIELKISNEKAKELINGAGIYYEDIVDNDLEFASEEVWNIFIYQLKNIYGDPYLNFNFEDMFLDVWNRGIYPYGYEIEKYMKLIK